MRNIMKSKEAGVMPFAVIAVIIIIVAGMYVFMNPEITGSEPYYETKSDFGAWGEEIIIEYEDGSTQSLKMIQDGALVTVGYGGKSITGVTYRLHAQATGTVYTSAEIELANYDVWVYFKEGSTTLASRVHSYGGISSIPLDGSWHNIGGSKGINIIGDSLFGNEDLFPTGDYIIKFTPTGSIRYHGKPDGEWKSVALPGGKTMQVTVTQDVKGSILVLLSSEYIT